MVDINIFPTLGDYIDYVETETTGDNEIKHALGGDVRIILYKELAEIAKIEDLFTDTNNVAVLYPTEKETVGHWVGLLFYPDEGLINVFDPYGFSIRDNIKFSIYMRKYDRRVRESLNTLLDACPYDVFVNHIEFQNRANQSIRTCGKHVATRMIFRDIIDNADYARFLKYKGMTPDEIVSLISL